MRSTGAPALRLSIVRCTPTAQRTAAMALLNSTSGGWLVILPMRPPYSDILG